MYDLHVWNKINNPVNISITTDGNKVNFTPLYSIKLLCPPLLYKFL